MFQQPAESVVLIFSGNTSGSGAIISSKGLVLTNWHVVESEDFVSIIYQPKKSNSVLQSPRVTRGKVIYTDEFRDLALVELLDGLPSDVKPMSFGEASELSIGQDVHAIGHPFSEYWTYTRGYISQIRDNYSWNYETTSHRANVIQTQTPINPGNSGGPLFDNNGKLIGINSFVLNEAEGINFAVSISEILKFLVDAKNGFYSPVSGQDCVGAKLWEGRNLDETADLIEYDRDCDGIVDYIEFRPDDLNEPITVYLDDDQNSVFEGWVRDFDRDGKWDASFWDTNRDGKAEILGIHEMGRILPIAFKAL